MLYLKHILKTKPCLAFMGIMVLLLIFVESKSFAEETDFLKRQEQVRKRFEKMRDKPKNKLVHTPPMIDSADSSASPFEWLVVAGLTGGIGFIFLGVFVGGLAIRFGLLAMAATLFSYFLSAAIEYVHDAFEGEPRAHDVRGLSRPARHEHNPIGTWG